MNIKEYIESGILEAYVSGAASDQERQEVECLSAVYPEIKRELDSLEETMHQFSFDYKVPVPQGLKNKIMAAVKEENQIPAMSVVSKESDSILQKEIAPTKKISARDPSKFPWRMAATLLLVVSCGLLYFLITLEDDYKFEIDTQRNQIVQLEDKLSDLSRKNSDQRTQLAVVSSPTALKIPLRTANDHGEENALVFWDPSNEKVFLDPGQLPAAPDNQQYQLWALKNNQPIDLGTVLKGDFGFQQMKNTPEADAFAITLEPLGGSEQPTMEQLKVIGKI